jgi:CheY-like chemotaxis protein
MLQSPELVSGGSGNPSVIRTLLLDDSAFDRTRIRRLGGKLDLGLDFQEAPSVQVMERCLDTQVFDLIMIDYLMPEADGLAALQMIRRHEANRGAATIMISGNADRQVAVSAMRNGCNDFLAKDELSPELLRRSVLGALNASRGLARHFDRPRLNLDLADLQMLLKLALDDKATQAILRAPLEDGLRAAAKAIGMEWNLNSQGVLEDFLIGFHRPDDFEFR